MLQRLSEDLEYHELLDKAAKCQSSLEQMCYVAAFSVSSYSTTVYRTGKPFNPLLGETYELDRRRESGYRSLCEQVGCVLCSIFLSLASVFKTQTENKFIFYTPLVLCSNVGSFGFSCTCFERSTKEIIHLMTTSISAKRNTEKPSTNREANLNKEWRKE